MTIEPIVSEGKVSNCLSYLASTDSSHAVDKAYKEGLEKTLKSTYGEQYTDTSGTNPERDCAVCAGEPYKGHLKKIEAATAVYEKTKNRRLTAALHIEVWRTEAANRRKGNI